MTSRWEAAGLWTVIASRAVNCAGGRWPDSDLARLVLVGRATGDSRLIGAAAILRVSVTRITSRCTGLAATKVSRGTIVTAFCTDRLT
jgi:hypothetical protein